MKTNKNDANVLKNLPGENKTATIPGLKPVLDTDVCKRPIRAFIDI